MTNRLQYLNDFYNNKCDEETRLNSKHGRVEFITTNKYIEKYLKNNNKILEIGAGTGKYSLYYASKGYEVTSVELIEYNLNVLKNKITKNMNIKAIQGDAINLENIKDNEYDITLVLGPLYHLYNKEDIDKAIKEALRVTKKGGKIFFAYLTSDSIMIDWALEKHHLIEGKNIDFDENFKMINYEEGLFAAYYIQEFKDMMNNYDTTYLHNVATDGMAHHVKEKIDNLTDEEYEIFIKYHLLSCEKEELQGYSNHMLYICEKN